MASSKVPYSTRYSSISLRFSSTLQMMLFAELIDIIKKIVSWLCQVSKGDLDSVVDDSGTCENLRIMLGM